MLAQRWLPFPSYTDPEQDIAQSIGAGKNYTVFIDAHGKTVHVHSGAYASTEQLDEDINHSFKLP